MPIALVADNCAAYIIAWFGINAAGCVAVTLNTQIVGDGLRHSLTHSEATIIVADAAWFEARLVPVTAFAVLPLVEFHSDRDLFGRPPPYVRADPSGMDGCS